MTSVFERDPLAGERADIRHAGVNLAVAWPFPPHLEAPYLDFAERAAALDPGLYVYPFSATHVTVLTAVNFKKHANPSPETARAVDEASEALGHFVRGAAADIGPFTLDIGPPVLARAAAFLPMQNPTGEIALLRERALAFCRGAGAIFESASAPNAVHATVVRFREAPRDGASFARAFDELARTVRLGRMTIDRLLVTLEDKPYMRAGRVGSSVSLVSGSE